MDKKAHWRDVYTNNSVTEVSWFQEHSWSSLRLIESFGSGPAASVIDVGGGAALLADDLLVRGYQDITVLDISAVALAAARERLGEQASQVVWLEADITQADLAPLRYDIWHDRAVFHFLTSPGDRGLYIDEIRGALKPGGHAVISTFALDGPIRCSGLDIVRYSAETLAEQFGDGFALKHSERESHRTPSGDAQNFLTCVFVRQ